MSSGPEFPLKPAAKPFETGAPERLATALTRVAAFDLPGPGGKQFDYLTIDPVGHRLFSAHLAGRAPLK